MLGIFGFGLSSARAQSTQVGGEVSEDGSRVSSVDVDDALLEDPTFPQPWEALGAHLGFEVHMGAMFPWRNRPLCPEGAACVFNGGGGIGGTLEKRWPAGMAIGFGYDAWFPNTKGIYDLGVMHGMRAQIRYLSARRSLVHPYIGGGVGANIFGDAVRVATVGWSLDVLLGLEVELSEVLGLQIGFPVRIFANDAFNTDRDRVERPSGINVAQSIHLGVVVLQSPRWPPRYFPHAVF